VIDLLDLPLDIGQVVKERLDDSPGRDRGQASGNHEDEPVLIIPAPPAVPRYTSFTPEAPLPPDQVINVRAHRFVPSYANAIPAGSLFGRLHKQSPLL